jgi:CelD/BcsL family acetyltransferase involved in cellulose biosynthesis
MLETRKKGVSTLRVLVNIGTPQTDAGGFLFNKDTPIVVDQMVKFILSEKAEWDLLEINTLLSAGQERYALTHLIDPKEVSIKIEENEHYFVPLTENWDAFSKRLSKKFLHNLRRAVKLANELGTVDLQHFTGGSVIPDLVQELININQHAHFPRLYNSPLEQKLLYELIKNGGDQTNWLDIYILKINDKPIAYEYGFVYEKRFESWRSGFDTNTPQQISVGKLLSMKVFETCFREEYHEVDFLRGDEAYKLEWKPEKKQYSNIRLFNRKTLQGMLSYHWLQNAKPLLKRIRKISNKNGSNE